MADDAGAQLLRAGLITKEDLERARASRKQGGGTTPEYLVEAGAIADEALTQFVSTHFMVPRVAVEALSQIPAGVRARLPADLAVELRAVPIAMDREDNLTVALSDPSDRHAVDQVRFFTGAYVVRAVCTQMQLAWALAHYYGHLTVLGRRLTPGSGVVAARGRARRGSGSSAWNEETTDATGPMKQRPPSADLELELAPRSGEITAPTSPVIENPVRLPAVVVEDWADLTGLESGAEDDPPRPPGPVPERTDVVLLDSVKYARTPRRPTEPGVAPPPPGDPGSRSRATDVEAMSTSGKDERNPARSTPVDDGWDMDEWSIPGTVPPPVDPAPAVTPAPLVGTLAATYGVAAPGEGIPTERMAVVDPELVDASAQRLLVALKGVEGGDSRDAVLASALTFIGGATSRAGFAAMKSGRLVGHSGPGGIARGGDVDLASGPLGAALAKPAPYRGVVTGAEATFVANLLGSATYEVSAAPVAVKNRLVGVLVGEACAPLIDEHLSVLARATGLALERILKATKR